MVSYNQVAREVQTPVDNAITREAKNSIIITSIAQQHRIPQFSAKSSRPRLDIRLNRGKICGPAGVRTKTNINRLMKRPLDRRV